MTVLVVDDNRTNRIILEQLAASWLMKSTVVESGPAALDALRQAADQGDPFRVMILDCMMPGMDGLEVAERIRNGSYPRDTKIILLSSAIHSISPEQARTLGIAQCMSKPFKQSDLLNAIMSALGDLPAKKRPDDAVVRRSDAPSLKVLLAEDGLVNQKLATVILEKSGHTVRLAVNGREAVAAVASERYDVVLMDVQMPEMSGYEATEQIRKMNRETGEHTPIVAMTANAMKGDREKCIDAGMDDYISKPFKITDLLAALERIADGESS